MSKPVVKWVGGKRQLLNEIKKNLPAKYNNYFEPFIGGGALFFDLKHHTSFINDYNKDLINLYRVIKTHPNKLLKDLEKHINTKEYYYSLREIDRDLEKYNELSNIEKASRFMYLNKTGFNGLYRVNQKNQYNVPFGSYKNPKIIDTENILSVSKLLQDTKITNGDFENIKKYIEKNDFVYFDPPYVPVNKTSSFTGYTDKGFDNEMQLRLKSFCDYIDSIGAYFMLSNSYTEFILELYKDYKIITVEANRALNCKAEGRGKIKEVLVVNYGKS